MFSVNLILVFLLLILAVETLVASRTLSLVHNINIKKEKNLIIFSPTVRPLIKRNTLWFHQITVQICPSSFSNNEFYHCGVFVPGFIFLFFLSLSLPNWIFGVIYLLCSKREERFKMISEKFDERLSLWSSVPKLAVNARKPTESYANFIYQCAPTLLYVTGDYFWKLSPCIRDVRALMCC